MGKEAKCLCNWAEESATRKVLLESNEIILRATPTTPSRRVPIAAITHPKVSGETLTFQANHEVQVTLHLGEKQAQSWLKTLTTPAPTLAKKLGITPQSKILLIGQPVSRELEAALAEASSQSAKNTPDLILAILQTPSELHQAIPQIQNHPTTPIWIVYPKGPKSPLPESILRGTLRSLNWIDTKVSSVSATHTALRFIHRP